MKSLTTQTSYPCYVQNVRYGAFPPRSYNFNVISLFAGKLRFIEAPTEEGSVGDNIQQSFHSPKRLPVVFSGQLHLSRVPQEVGEVIVQLGVVRKSLQPGSVNRTRQLASTVQSFADFTLIIFYFIQRHFNKVRRHIASITRLSTTMDWKGVNNKNMEDIMKVFHVAKKGKMLDTLGSFYIYKETRAGNQINLLAHKDPYRGRTAPLTSKRCILNIYSTNIGTEYFKNGINWFKW